jgi:hypothetical protein
LPNDVAVAVDFDNTIVELIGDEVVARLVEPAVIIGKHVTDSGGECGDGNQEAERDSAPVEIHGIVLRLIRDVDAGKK